MHCVRLCFVISVPLLLTPVQLFGRVSIRLLNVVYPVVRASCSLVTGIGSGDGCAAGCEEARYVCGCPLRLFLHGLALEQWIWRCHVYWCELSLVRWMK